MHRPRYRAALSLASERIRLQPCFAEKPQFAYGTSCGTTCSMIAVERQRYSANRLPPRSARGTMTIFGEKLPVQVALREFDGVAGERIAEAVRSASIQASSDLMAVSL